MQMSPSLCISSDMDVQDARRQSGEDEDVVPKAFVHHGQ